MPNRLIELFGSYDLFGKSVPGAVLTLGILATFPSSTFKISGDTSFLGVIALVFLLLFIGLMIGQGVHTLADNIEKAFLWFARRVRNWLTLLRVRFGRDITISSLKKEVDEDAPLKIRFWFNAYDKSVEWVRRRYWGIYDSLVGHRYLLGKSIQWNFDAENPDGRWKIGSKGRIYEGFVSAFQEEFDLDIRTLTPPEIRDQYPLITAKLSKEGIGQYRTFQSIYSFCRSMWVVFLCLTLVFGFLINGPAILEWLPWFEGIRLSVLPLPYTPVGVEIIPTVIQSYVPWILLIGTVVFFDAAGTYKRHYVEYLIADFAVSFDPDSPSESIEFDNPSSKQRIQEGEKPDHPQDDW